MRTILSSLVLTTLLASASSAQGGRFLTIGGGASFPTGSSSSAMDPGWVTEVMVGQVLPGGFASVRLGGMLGQSRVTGGSGMDGMAVMESGTQRMLGAMAGLMAMPRWDYDWTPYVFATAGGVNAKFHGSTNSFAWATGAGMTLQWSALDFYVEGRFLQARKNGGHGEMVSITSGLRFTR